VAIPLPVRQRITTKTTFGSSAPFPFPASKIQIQNPLKSCNKDDSWKPVYELPHGNKQKDLLKIWKQ